MLGENKGSDQQVFFTPVFLESVIPGDHILRRVDRVLDLGWVREEVRGLYSETMGRPSIDPEAAVRLMLAGFFHGIVHDRKLMREAQVNLAMRWFAGYKLDEELPDHSTLSKLRKRWGVQVFRRVFTRSVKACIDAGLVDAETVHVDATLIRANVSWESITERHVEEVVRENDGGDDGETDGKRGSGKKVKVSATDPDASLTKSTLHDKAQPRYKQHTAVDNRSGVVLDVDVTTGRRPEASVLVEQVRRVEENTGERPRAVTADSSYSTGRNYSELEGMGIEAVIPTRKVPAQGECFPIEKFRYDAKNDVVRCPAGKKLKRSSRYKNSGWYYRSDPSICGGCPLKMQCVSRGMRSRKVLIVDGYPALLRARRAEKRSSIGLRDEYVRHKWLVEGRHGEAKVQHGLARAVRRGLQQVAIQVLMTMAAMNLKRLAAASLTAFTYMISILASHARSVPTTRPLISAALQLHQILPPPHHFFNRPFRSRAETDASRDRDPVLRDVLPQCPRPRCRRHHHASASRAR